MSEKKFNPTAFILFVLAASVAGMMAWRLVARAPQRTEPEPYELLDRAKIPELEVKGEPPLGATSWSEIEAPESPAADAALIAKGRELFQQSCAACHGAEGKGDGPLAHKYDLPSPPANLSKPLQSIKIHSSATGTSPKDSDLFRTITRGLPGTAMYSYRALPAEQRWALVHYIKSLSPDYAKSPPEDLTIPEKPTDGSNFQAIGGEYYRTVCFNCHGEKGLGGSALLRDSDSGKVFPGLQFARDGGAFMLGGSSERDIARTLMAGMNGRSPMRSVKSYLYPSESMSAEQMRDADRKLWGVVIYVRGLIEAQKK